jgi:hypothetical protein
MSPDNNRKRPVNPLPRPRQVDDAPAAPPPAPLDLAQNRLDAPFAAEQAAQQLQRAALAATDDPDVAELLVVVADGWRQLAESLAEYPNTMVRRPPADDDDQ